MMPSGAIVRLLFLFTVLLLLGSCQNPSRIQADMKSSCPTHLTERDLEN
jgi:hypothetical protein